MWLELFLYILGTVTVLFSIFSIFVFLEIYFSEENCVKRKNR